jgi:hypothetical protein
VSGPYDGEQPGHPPRPQQPWQPPFQQPPSHPFAQPVPRRPFQPPPQPPFQPPADRWFSSERGLGTAASILICLVALAEILIAFSDWYTYRVVKKYAEGAVKDPDRLDRADLIGGVTGLGYLLALLAASVVFIVWLWRVRRNAELFCAGRHRHARGWVIGGWICPIVNLWFPKQIVDDVIAASDPRTPPRIPDLRGIEGNGLVLIWWITWIVSLVLGNLGGSAALSDAPDVDDLGSAASLSTVSAVVTAVCAALAIRVLGLVNRLQVSRPWIPWWATDPSAAPPGQPYGPVPPSATQ